jgi:hypothetical protein
VLLFIIMQALAMEAFEWLEEAARVQNQRERTTGRLMGAECSSFRKKERRLNILSLLGIISHSFAGDCALIIFETDARGPYLIAGWLAPTLFIYAQLCEK